MSLSLSLFAAEVKYAVTPYGANTNGIPEDHPKVVRAILNDSDAIAGEEVRTKEQLKEVMEKNRAAVKVAVANRPKPEASNEEKAKSKALEEENTEDEVAALLKKIDRMEDQIKKLKDRCAALEAKATP